ncbi:MAG: SUMF1/EgtB/PvdO family nonheme iron enzyme [Pseudomarimonas sp.]
MIRCILLVVIATLSVSACQPSEAPETSVDAAPNVDEAAVASGDHPPREVEQTVTLRGAARRQQQLEAEASSTEWHPQSTPNPDESIEVTLTRADIALTEGQIDEGRLYAGEGNALSLYLSVLANQPDHPVALAAVSTIGEQLLASSTKLLAAGDLQGAATIERVVARIRPEDPMVGELAAKIAVGREIELLIAQAQRLMSAGKLIEPGAESALSAFQEVLALDPQSETAKTGLLAIEAQLILAATEAAMESNYARADQLLVDAISVGTGSSAVQDATTRVVELRQRRAAEIVERANAHIMQGELAEASKRLAELEAVSAQSEGIEDLRNRIERARIYGGLEPGQRIRDPLKTGGLAPEMVVMPAGSFRMGAGPAEEDRRPSEGPVHLVTFARGFALSRREISVGEFRAFVQATAYVADSVRAKKSTIYDEKSGSMTERSGVTWENDHVGKKAADDLPAIHVSWNDAKAFANWLAAETDKTYRLPTEAEFEYVLRAGVDARFPWGDASPTEYVGNLTGASDRSASKRNWVNAFENYSDGYWGPAPVGQFEANRFGLEDIVGNVSEWVEDCWHDTYQRAPADGSAWVNDGCNRRAIRGASWASAPDQVRSAFRLNAVPTTTNARLGFRVARELE